MRENGDRTTGTTPGRLALEREAVEVVADLGSDDREVASHHSDTVGVLDGADVVSRLVAANGDRLLRNARCLV